MGDISHYRDIEPYITRDGSVIRELMHPDRHRCVQQSLAEATIPPGSATLLHRHHTSEEVYYLLQGSGMMRLGEQEFEVAQGDSVCIPPGVAHNIRNTAEQPLILLCACAPAYAHEDTELCPD